MAKGPIKMFYVIGKDFAGFELEAVCDDGAFSLRREQIEDVVAYIMSLRIQ